MTITTGARTDIATVGSLLRDWRQRRRLSQLELSHLAGVSTRHLSCVETGRSRPTPEMIVRLAEHLDVPVRRRNEMLLAGGYAPRYAESALDDETLAPVMAGLRQLLEAHLPFPALLLDDAWDIVDTNAAVDVLLTGCDPALLEPPVNALRITLHPRGLAPRIRNLAQWADHLHHQVTARADRTGDPRLRDLAAELAGYVDLPTAPPPTPGPVLPMEIEIGGGAVLSFVSVAARMQTAADATLDELHLETFLPADTETADHLRRATGA